MAAAAADQETAGPSSHVDAGKQTNSTQTGNYNSQYNAESITINEVRQHHSDDISKWLSSSNPWINHNSAREQHEDETGAWFLQDARYQRWKRDGGCLWLHGKAGCGKTVLCSSAIENLRKHCQQEDIGLAIFYFSFSDNRKQSYNDLLRSLLAQLSWKEPALSMIRRVKFRSGNDVPGIDELEELLYVCFDAFDVTYVVLDALDECPKENNSRQCVLERLERLSRRAANLRLFATSREIVDIRICMEILKSIQITMMDNTVDTDIRQYLSARLAKDYRLRRLKDRSKQLVAESIAAKAHGMFRYAHLQLQEIQNLDSHRPSKIQEVIDRLPSSLDESYSRVLESIRESDRDDAITLLRWLAYAQYPLTLAQLVEVVVIQVNEETVDDEDRGDLEDVLNILPGLVAIVEDDRPSVQRSHNLLHGIGRENLDEGLFESRSIGSGTKITLAHFSVQEYLGSNRILTSAPSFHLTPENGHYELMRGCLAYLRWYSDSKEKTSSARDLDAFPLLLYASQSWYHHAFQHEEHGAKEAYVLMVTSLLTSAGRMSDWTAIVAPDYDYISKFSDNLLRWSGMALYYASYLGLTEVVKTLLEQGADTNIRGGRYTTALQAASHEGHVKVAKLLLEHGADVNATDVHHYGNALCAASNKDRYHVVELLLDKGADINSPGYLYGTALQCASYGHSRSTQTLKLLIDRGANVKGPCESRNYSSALAASASIGHDEKVRLLLDNGADPNVPGGFVLGNALWLACRDGHIQSAKLLIQAGADINAQSDMLGNALESAIRENQVETVRMLISEGADVNAKTQDVYGSALNAAVYENRLEIIKLLISGGADIHARIVQYGTVLHTAASMGHSELVKYFIELGVNVHAQAGGYGSVLCAAAERGHCETAEILLQHGADPNAPANRFGSASQAAAESGHLPMIELLLVNGADINQQGGLHGSALQAAAACNEDAVVVEFLLDHGADVNASGGKYGSPLEAALENDRHNSTRLLLERGARNDIGVKQPELTEEFFMEEEYREQMQRFEKAFEGLDVSD